VCYTAEAMNVGHRQLMDKTDSIPNASARRALLACRPGFTLIELLIVICILALLVAILVPSLSRARLLAKRTACYANLHAIGIAAAAYQTEYGSYIPINWGNLDNSYRNQWGSWRVMLLPYVPAVTTFNCPAARDGSKLGEVFHTIDELTGQDRDGTRNAGSYGIMLQDALPTCKVVNFNDDIKLGTPSWSGFFPTDAGVAWKDPANSVYVADSCMTKSLVSYPSQGYANYGTSAILPPSVMSASGTPQPNPAYFGTGISRRFADRHLGTNCLFVDGHVANYPTQTLDSMNVGSPDCIWDVN
jgi:prepilin-type N-terminal cleavage/methylation domain-containing protein/prepilin-type processing-associated H-X9-DG protein